MTVRDFKASDFPAVCRIYLEAKREELKFESRPFNVTPLNQDEALLAAFDESDVIVFDDGTVRGFAATFAGQLRALFVDGEVRGRGIGQSLLDAVLARGTEGISLNVAKSNVDALRFYARNGFSNVGETVRHYAGYEIMYLKMQLAPKLGEVIA
ncbi:GNAT family N-acetyltransferase [Pseudoduganella sp. R-43]|uniref:GNAT family N-acetyltransferase n=1 Tax=unclassified Pseudoduganella TaxID=2637179 RepID=UPI003CE9971F